jgi:hypothetical protein
MLRSTLPRTISSISLSDQTSDADDPAMRLLDCRIDASWPDATTPSEVLNQERGLS